MYRKTGAGEEPHPPALLCMVVLLQGYVGASDVERRADPQEGRREAEVGRVEAGKAVGA
jgi:hypothetical protein